MNEKTVQMLPRLSQEIFEGPEAVLKLGELHIRYGTEDGDIRELAFRGIVGFRFTDFNSCRADHVRAYDKILELAESELLEELRADSHTHVVGIRHYRIFIDELGCYDILAKEFDA